MKVDSLRYALWRQNIRYSGYSAVACGLNLAISCFYSPVDKKFVSVSVLFGLIFFITVLFQVKIKWWLGILPIIVSLIGLENAGRWLPSKSDGTLTIVEAIQFMGIVIGTTSLLVFLFRKRLGIILEKTYLKSAKD